MRHLRDELPVDVERVLGAVPGGRDLVPFALLPVSDRRAEATRDTTVVRELEDQVVDVLDHLNATVAQLKQRGSVLVGRPRFRLQPERHRPRGTRDLADVPDLDSRVGGVLNAAPAREADVAFGRPARGGVLNAAPAREADVAVGRPARGGGGFRRGRTQRPRTLLAAYAFEAAQGTRRQVAEPVTAGLVANVGGPHPLQSRWARVGVRPVAPDAALVVSLARARGDLRGFTTRAGRVRGVAPGPRRAVRRSRRRRLAGSRHAGQLEDESQESAGDGQRHHPLLRCPRFDHV